MIDVAHALLVVCAAAVSVNETPAPINPFPPPLLTEPLGRWSFERDTAGWVAQHDCQLAAADGLLKVRCTGNDPYLHRPVDFPGGGFLLQLRARCRGEGHGAIYWATERSPRHGEDKTAHFELLHDGLWHDYEVRFATDGRLTDLRLDPGTAAGEFDIQAIRLLRARPHPLSLQRIEVLPKAVRAVVHNSGPQPLEFSAGDGRREQIAASGSTIIELPLAGQRPLEAVTVSLSSPGLPKVERTLFVHHPDVQTDWIVLPPSSANASAGVRVQVARDGSLARVFRDGSLAAIAGPLVLVGGQIPALRLSDAGPPLRFEGDKLVISLALDGPQMRIIIDSQEPCEGPVLRALGKQEQALFAGVEYLENGEASSSTLDIDTPEHVRFAPDPLKVTMPLMAVVTGRASLAMTWRDLQLQPVFASPNFFDGTADHRMSLRGRRIAATIHVDRLSLEEVILATVKEQGLPPLPPAPRTAEEQYKLCLRALRGPLHSEAGWGHCVEPSWPRHPFADIASTCWRLSGEVPGFPQLVPGGAHVHNDCIWFVTGRAQTWLDQQRHKVEGILKRQQADGSFRYDGPYRRGHFEDTAVGVCARPAMELLEYARITGDQAALAAAVRTLDYMKRFRTPRGAQVWEIPLHTPDQLASAYAVWAYVRGYELTGEKQYLAEARRWAASGIPFVYLWSRYPVMLYATPPVYGATNWKSPNWIGLPVQWVGGVYAYALALLAPYDRTLDWRQLARGILLSAEQQQYPDGPNAGLLPDSFVLASQQRRGPNINPCALVSLRMLLDGQLDSLCVASEGKHRLAAPFPVVLRDGRAVIRAKPGVKYQVVIDGRRIVETTSRGEDTIPWPQ